MNSDNEQERPFVMVGGKKYVLAEGETIEQKPEPEIFQRLTPPPRSVSLSVRLLLLLNNGSAPMFGWFFACFGMVFNIVFLPLVFSGLPDLLHRNYKPAGKGVVTEVHECPTKLNDRTVYRITFNNSADDEGRCYTSKNFEVGENVDLEQCRSRIRITGTRLGFAGASSVFALFVVIFPIVGMSIVLYGTVQGKKAIHLLRDGEIGKGLYLDMKPTGTRVNDQCVMKLHFQFTADDGETYDAYATALDTSKLTDDSVEPLFYDPMDPSRSVLLDSLPAGVRFDELEGTFRANPVRVLLPVLMCGLFLAELAALIYAISIGGIISAV